MAEDKKVIRVPHNLILEDLKAPDGFRQYLILIALMKKLSSFIHRWENSQLRAVICISMH